MNENVLKTGDAPPIDGDRFADVFRYFLRSFSDYLEVANDRIERFLIGAKLFEREARGVVANSFASFENIFEVDANVTRHELPRAGSRHEDAV